MAKKGGKYYVVWVGAEPGVYDNWEDAQEQVANYPGARYKSFRYEDEAIEAYRNGDAEDAGALRRMSSKPVRKVNYEAFPDIDIDAITVDASCMGNPGVMEYQCVELRSGRRLFRVGPFAEGTNNIGEYLAIVHALALLAQTGDKRTIYSDSRTALSWVRKRKANTKLAPNPKNRKLLELLQRADTWLQTHTWSNRLLKWDTDNWGEIPADFDRK